MSRGWKAFQAGKKQPGLFFAEVLDFLGWQPPERSADIFSALSTVFTRGGTYTYETIEARTSQAGRGDG